MLPANQAPSSEFTRWAKQTAAAADKLAKYLNQAEQHRLRRRVHDALTETSQEGRNAAAGVTWNVLSNHPDQLAHQMTRLSAEIQLAANRARRQTRGPRPGWRGSDYLVWCLALATMSTDTPFDARESSPFVRLVEIAFGAVGLDDPVGAAKRMEKKRADMTAWEFETLYFTVAESGQANSQNSAD